MRLLLTWMRRSRHLIVLAAAGASLGVALAGSAHAAPVTGPFEVDDGTDSFAIKGFTYAPANATGVLGYGGNSSATNATGVAGYVTSPFSVGVTGYAASTGVNSYGVYGYSNTGNGVYGQSNSADVASIYGLNNQTGGTAVYGYSTGEGVLGISTTTSGVVGITRDPSEMTIGAGVTGEDESTSPYNIGVEGASTDGVGVFGETVSGIAGRFWSNMNIALEAQSNFSYATLGMNTGEAGTFAGFSGSAAHPALVAVEGNAGTDPFATYTFPHDDETFIIQAGTANYSGAAPAGSSDVQVSGDLYVQGQVYSLCSGSGGSFPVTAPHDHCQKAGSFTPALQSRNSSGSNVTTYAVQHTVPTIEDSGEARLVNGETLVQLEPGFAATIDTTRPYLVFVTPEGDCHGLYVTSKSAKGFVVRELMNGRSTIAFQYGIVAHPFGDTSTRLPVAAASRPAPLPRNFPQADMLAKLKERAPQGVTLGPLPKRLPPPTANFLKR